MTLLEELAQLLDTLGLGDYHADGSIGGTIFLARLPDKPDQAMAVALYGGTESDAARPHDAPSVQVRVRGTTTDVRAALDAGQAVYDALHGLHGITLAGGTRLDHLIGVNGGPAYIGPDQNNRDEYTINFRAHISRSTPNRSSI